MCEIAMKLVCYQLTSAGDRETNQDAMGHLINEDYGLFIVADGLGGYQSGEKAAQFFCQAMMQLAERYTDTIRSFPLDVLSAWIEDAVDEMKRLFGNDPTADEAHTTCAILFVNDLFVLTAHCGDSRVYRMSPRKVIWRTRDHSVLQKLLDQGEITEEEMGLHPEQNQLTRSINIAKSHPVEVNLYPPMEPGETFVLCTDGFWEHVKPLEWLQVAEPGSGRVELGKMARLSVLRAKGKSDNVTVQWVRYLA